MWRLSWRCAPRDKNRSEMNLECFLRKVKWWAATSTLLKGTQVLIWVCGFPPLSKPATLRSEMTSPPWSLFSGWIYNEYHVPCRGPANLISCADVSVCCHSAEWSLPLHKHGAAHCGSVYPAHTQSSCNEQALKNTKTKARGNSN